MVWLKAKMSSSPEFKINFKANLLFEFSAEPFIWIFLGEVGAGKGRP